MTLPAGATPPAPDSFGEVDVAHAIDGDGTALCHGGRVERIDALAWLDTPGNKRCTACAIIAPTREIS
jgi:hypothetical protein